MNLKRLMLTASCQRGVRGRMARQASAEGEFVRALDETDRLLRIDPPGPDAEAPARIASALSPRAAPSASAPTPALSRARWRTAAGLAITAGAAAALALAPVALWRATPPPGALTMLADDSPPTAPEAPRLTWTLVAGLDHPLRAEAAALAADMRQFGHLVAPGVMPMPPDER